jgi:protein arginine kinase
MIPTFLEYERKVREHFLSHFKVKLEDRVYRALALLQSARTVTTDEAMESLSAVRLGVVAGLLTKWRLPEIHELFVLVQPAHLRRLAGKPLDQPTERDIHRATMLRGRLAA